MLAVDAPWKLFAFAGVAACCGELVSHPFDVVKTRMQVRGQAHAAARFPYRHSLHALQAIALDEGPRALYSGIRPALLRQATYGSLRIGLYEPIKAALGGGGSGTSTSTSTSTPSLLLRGAAGALSGAAAATLCTPTDLIKVRMQAAAAGQGYSGIGAAVRGIVREGGGRVGALWRGWAPTAQRAALVAAAELAGYETIKESLLRAGAASSAVTTHLAASLSAGAAASLLSSPWDVVRVRVMEGSSGGAWQVLRALLQREGAAALLAGVPADFARRGPHTVASFLVLEQLRAHWGGR